MIFSRDPLTYSSYSVALFLLHSATTHTVPCHVCHRHVYFITENKNIGSTIQLFTGLSHGGFSSIKHPFSSFEAILDLTLGFTLMSVHVKGETAVDEY